MLGVTDLMDLGLFDNVLRVWVFSSLKDFGVRVLELRLMTFKELRLNLTR